VIAAIISGRKLNGHSSIGVRCLKGPADRAPPHKAKKVKSQGSIPGAANRKTITVVEVEAVRIGIVVNQITDPGNARPSIRRTPPDSVAAQIVEPATRAAGATRQARETARIRGASVWRIPTSSGGLSGGALHLTACYGFSA